MFKALVLFALLIMNLIAYFIMAVYLNIINVNWITETVEFYYGITYGLLCMHYLMTHTYRIQEK